MECQDFDLRTVVTILIVFWAIAAQLARALKRLNKNAEPAPQPTPEAYDEESYEHEAEELPPATLTPAERRALAERLGVSPTWIEQNLEQAEHEVVPQYPTFTMPAEVVEDRPLPAAWSAPALDSTNLEEGVWEEKAPPAYLRTPPPVSAPTAPPIGLELSPAAWRDAIVLHELWHRPHRR